MPKLILPITIVFIIATLLLVYLLIFQKETPPDYKIPSKTTTTNNVIPSPNIVLETPLNSKILQTQYHVFQRFNNCGPAALSMALSHYSISASQEELGASLRPYQNSLGNNDDKSTTLEELAEKSKEFGLVPFHRPNGDIKKIRLFIAYDMPIIARTWTKPNEDIGHYRIVKGYDDSTGKLIQDDSLQNKNLWYSYNDFNTIWQKFNFEYLVLVPKDKVEIARAILEKDVDEKAAWEKAAQKAKQALVENPNDTSQQFNLSVALYNIGDYKGATEEFEKVENRLPFRTLWYQIEPIEAYFMIGQYERVFELTDKILNNHNRAFSELYIIRGNIYQKEGKINLAKDEFEMAILYNKNLETAKQLLNFLN